MSYRNIVYFILFYWSCAIGQPNSVFEAHTCDPGLMAPVINTSPLPEYGYDQLNYGMNMGLEVTKGGRFWACLNAGGDDPDAFLMLVSSDNKGVKWSDPKVVVDPHDIYLGEKRCSQNGNLWTDPLGRMWFFFDQSMGDFDGRAGVWYSICENPDDHFPNWSDPVRLWHGTAKTKPIVLSSGEWILPVSLLNRNIIDRFPPKYLDAYHDLDSLRMAHVFISSDQGMNWERTGGVCFPNASYDEHHIVELRNGSLWMIARTKDGIWESASKNKGKTWSPPEKYLNHVDSRFFIRRLSSGNLLLVKHGCINERTKVRSHLKAFISKDEGKSWKGGLLLDEREGISYPDGFQESNGVIHISYDRNRSTDGEIIMVSFEEKDIINPKKNAIGSKSRIIIYRPLLGINK